MKYHQGIHPQNYENMVKRLLGRMGTYKKLNWKRKRRKMEKLIDEYYKQLKFF